jgi:hypothetical protein
MSRFDPTPARAARAEQGSLHPVTLVMEEI